MLTGNIVRKVEVELVNVHVEAAVEALQLKWHLDTSIHVVESTYGIIFSCEHDIVRSQQIFQKVAKLQKRNKKVD